MEFHIFSMHIWLSKEWKFFIENRLDKPSLEDIQALDMADILNVMKCQLPHQH
jgi:hypothetical protein